MVTLEYKHVKAAMRESKLVCTHIEKKNNTQGKATNRSTKKISEEHFASCYMAYNVLIESGSTSIEDKNDRKTQDTQSF